MFGGTFCARAGEARCKALPNEDYCLTHHPNPDAAHRRALDFIAGQKGARGCSLRGLSVESADWADFEFSDCDLSGISIHGGTLADSRFYLCLFSSAGLRDVVADRVGMDFCGFAAGTIERCEFTGSNITLVSFNQAAIVDTRFDGSDLFHSRFVGARLTNVGLIDCNLKGVDFRGSTSEHVGFKYSNVEDALF